MQINIEGTTQERRCKRRGGEWDKYKRKCGVIISSTAFNSTHTDIDTKSILCLFQRMIRSYRSAGWKPVCALRTRLTITDSFRGGVFANWVTQLLTAPLRSAKVGDNHKYRHVRQRSLRFALVCPCSSLHQASPGFTTATVICPRIAIITLQCFAYCFAQPKFRRTPPGSGSAGPVMCKQVKLIVELQR